MTNFKTSSGCDSISTVEVKLNLHSETFISRSICQGDSLEFNGDKLFEEEQYTFQLTNVIGCDSIVFLDLQVDALIEESLDLEICEGDSICLLYTSDAADE